MNKTQLLKTLKADLKAAERAKQTIDGKISKWIREYNGEPYGNEEEGKSAIVSRDIKKQSDWLHPSLVDPFVSTPNVIKCDPVTYEDRPAAKQNEIVLNTQFCRKFDRFNFITKAAKVMDKEGTVVIQTGWDYEYEKYTAMEETVSVNEAGETIIEIKEVENIRTLKNQPTARICRNQDIYIDPTCQDELDKAQFVIHRYESNLSTLRSDGRYKNLDKVEQSLVEANNSYGYESPDKSDFRFTDIPRKKIVVYEYWGNVDIDGDGIAEPIVCVWVEDVIIRQEANPFPDKKLPFIAAPFMSIPFELHGEANAETIGVSQKVKTATLRGMIDNMAAANNGQIGIRKGALDPVNAKRFLQGKNFEFTQTMGETWEGGYNAIPASAFNLLTLMDHDIESNTGVKSFSDGISGSSLGSTATAARGAMDASAVRRLFLVRNMAENLIKPLMRKWMSYNAVFLEDYEVFRLTNDEYVEVKRDDLDGSFDIEITVATAEDNSAKAQELSFMLQTVGPQEDPEIRRELLAQYMELIRMPDMAKRLREFQPQPDPIAEEIRQLEVDLLRKEIAFLEARTEALLNPVGGSSEDMQLKAAKVEETLAKARKIESETDLVDLRFLKEDADDSSERAQTEADRNRQFQLARDEIAFNREEIKRLRELQSKVENQRGNIR